MQLQDLRHAYAVVRGVVVTKHPPLKHKDKFYTGDLDTAMLKIETESVLLNPEMFDMVPQLNTTENYEEVTRHLLEMESKEFVQECIEHELRASGPQTRNRLIRYCKSQTQATRKVIKECIDEMHEEKTIVLENAPEGAFYEWNYEKGETE